MEEEPKQRLSSQEIPLYGLGKHHVQLRNETSQSENEDFFVVIQGSRLAHVTAAKMGSDGQTLSFVVPGHDLPENVSITPYRCFDNYFEPCGTEFSFHYIKDAAQDIAEYLKTKSDQLGHHSCLDIAKIFSEWTEKFSNCSDPTDLQGHQLSDALRGLDERITQAMANLVHPLQWTEANTQTWQHDESVADLQFTPLHHFAVNLGLVHLSSFVTHQLTTQRAFTSLNQDGSAPRAQNGEHGAFRIFPGSADPVAGVCCVWSNSLSMLRFCPASDSLTLTVQHTVSSSSHQNMLLAFQKHQEDHATLKLVSAFKACWEANQKGKEHSVYKDTQNKTCVEETQINNGLEDHGALCLDDDSEELSTSSLPVNAPPLDVDDKCRETSVAEGVTAAAKLSISGVTRDSTKTDDTVWDTEANVSTLEATDMMPSLHGRCQLSTSVDCSLSALPLGQSENTDTFDLSPSLVALELNSEDDSAEAMTPVSPFLPDVERSDEKQDNFSPFVTVSCNRSLSASLSEHTSKEPKQDTRLRSYSYSSSKISFRRGQPTRDFSPDPMDSVSYGRSLLQALSLSKSLSLLHPCKQRASCISEQSQDKRIEEEELDKYNTPLKVESEKHKVIRTFSFLKNRMSTTRNRSKSKKDREAKDRQLNGHRFSTGLCLGPTMCVVCDKPATGKDYVHCSVCTAIVHKSCKESIPQCLKSKYVLPMGKNKTASLPQNFTVRESGSQYILPTTSSSPVVMPKDKKDSGPLSSPFSKSVERLCEVSESDFGPSKDSSPSEDPLTSPTCSPSTDHSPTEDCVDAYIFKDILADAANYEAESWSSSVDNKFCRKQDKRTVKRQDVIYELMQTEIHHLQTLHVMAEVFRRGVKEEVQLDADAVERLFPCLDQLLLFHHGFFAAMKERRQNSQPQGQNYLIQRIGDVLLQQFSDENGKRMTDLYGEFCSHHNEAVSFFKELQLNNKKFQSFIKQQGNNYLARRREIPECILLVTQRITKYPVLLERILQYTQTGTEEHRDLSKALARIRELITAVNQLVRIYERQQKLQEVWTRMENRSSAKLKNGHTYRKQNMMRPGQTLAHEGVLFWKSATGRLKDVLALLLTDSLVFLQEKDQKFVFAAVDQKPPVIALQKLIVREVANEERGMFLISASTAGPEMYEVRTCSKDERNTWMRLIREAVESCPEGEEDYTSESEEEKRAAEVRIQKIQRLQESLNSHDQQICTSLEEKLQIYAELSTITREMDNSLAEPRLLVQRHQEDMPQAAFLLNAALQEAENLKTILSSKIYPPPGGSLESHVDSPFSCSPFSNLETFSDLRVVTVPEANEQSVTKDSALHSLMGMQNEDINSKVIHSVHSLTQLLYSLKAAVALQDSWYEVKRLLLLESERPSPRPKRRPHFTSLRGNALQEQEKQRNLEKQKEEAATAQRLQDQLRQEKDRWERECHARESQQEEQERQLQEREKQCHLKAEMLKRERAELDAQLEEYQQSLERLREGQKTVEKERERLETQRKRLQICKHSQQKGTILPHMLIPLDRHTNPAVTQPIDPDDNGSVFVNEANCGINNRHILQRQNDPSTHNCLNALLARSASRRHLSVPSSAHPEADNQDWVMHSEYFYSPSDGLGNKHSATDVNREGYIQDSWSSTGDFVLPHLSDAVELLSETDSSGEEPKEETIVYL